jgi:hypothetical protein
MQSIGYYLLHKEYEIIQNFIYNKEPEYNGDALIYSNRRSWRIIGAGCHGIVQIIRTQVQKQSPK